MPQGQPPKWYQVVSSLGGGTFGDVYKVYAIQQAAYDPLAPQALKYIKKGKQINYAALEEQRASLLKAYEEGTRIPYCPCILMAMAEVEAMEKVYEWTGKSIHLKDELIEGQMFTMDYMEAGDVETFAKSRHRRELKANKDKVSEQLERIYEKGHIDNDVKLFNILVDLRGADILHPRYRLADLGGIISFDDINNYPRTAAFCSLFVCTFFFLFADIVNVLKYTYSARIFIGKL